MGRRSGPGGRSGRGAQKQAPARRWRDSLAACTCAALAWGFTCMAPALAQSPPAPAAPDPAPAQTDDQGKPKDRLLVEAKTLVYNRNTNVVSAEGNVQLYYQGRVLEADKVIYDRNANRVYAEGHGKMTDADGTVTYSDKFDLTDDFRNGFINSLSAITKDKTYFTGPAGRTERGRNHGLREGHLHGLRALRGASGASAALAGQGPEDHPQGRRADDLFRGRRPRTLWRADRLPALFLHPGPDGDAQDRLPAGPDRLRIASRPRRGDAVLLEPGAELRRDPHADDPVQTGRARRGRMAPSPRQRQLFDPGDRHLSARPEPVLAGALRHGRPPSARLHRDPGQVLHQSELEVRLGHRRLQRQILLSGLQHPQQQPRVRLHQGIDLDPPI